MVMIMVMMVMKAMIMLKVDDDGVDGDDGNAGVW